MVRLERHEIVGRTVQRLVQVGENQEGISVGRVFVFLDNGKAFELIYCDPSKPPPIIQQLPFELSGIKSEIVDSRIYAEIVDVVSCEFWPSLGIVLAGGILIYCTDDPSSRSVGVCIDTIGRKYFLEELRSVFGLS